MQPRSSDASDSSQFSPSLNLVSNPRRGKHPKPGMGQFYVITPGHFLIVISYHQLKINITARLASGTPFALFVHLSYLGILPAPSLFF